MAATAADGQLSVMDNRRARSDKERPEPGQAHRAPLITRQDSETFSHG